MYVSVDETFTTHLTIHLEVYILPSPAPTVVPELCIAMHSNERSPSFFYRAAGGSKGCKKSCMVIPKLRKASWERFMKENCLKSLLLIIKTWSGNDVS